MWCLCGLGTSDFEEASGRVGLLHHKERSKNLVVMYSVHISGRLLFAALLS